MNITDRKRMIDEIVSYLSKEPAEILRDYINNILWEFCTTEDELDTAMLEARKQVEGE